MTPTSKGGAPCPPTTIFEYLSNDINGQIRTSDLIELDKWAYNTRTTISSNDWVSYRHFTYYYAVALGFAKWEGKRATYPPLNIGTFGENRKYIKLIKRNYTQLRKRLTYSEHLECLNTIRVAEQGTCSVAIETDEDVFRLDNLPFQLCYEGSIGQTHSFTVYVSNNDGSVMEIGACVFGPLGWFPDSRLAVNLQSEGFTNYNPGFRHDYTLLDGQYYEHSDVLDVADSSKERFFNYCDFLVSKGLMVPYMFALRVDAILCDKGLKRLPIRKLVNTLKVPHKKSPHDRRAHEAFVWVKEANTIPNELIYGRRINKHPLVKVRRQKKASKVNH